MSELGEIRYGRVKIRRNMERRVRQSAEQIDGGRYRFSFLWKMDDGDPYPGEEAWAARDPDYPRGAPVWVASGDIEWDQSPVRGE